MSRVAKKPVALLSGVEATIDGQLLIVKGSKGKLQYQIPNSVKINKTDKELQFSPANDVEIADAVAGSLRAIVQNMVTGVTKGFERKLVLIGVGYRAQAQGRKLNLSLGFSHPIDYQLPEGISAETPTQTEIVIKGVDAQLVGQVAAKIRSFRPPEPYKGKGVRYQNEKIVMKEAKKK
jgi:large subunit ribosomal protein L6